VVLTIHPLVSAEVKEEQSHISTLCYGVSLSTGIICEILARNENRSFLKPGVKFYFHDATALSGEAASNKEGSCEYTE
jgi:hypothetical protein